MILPPTYRIQNGQDQAHQKENLQVHRFKVRDQHRKCFLVTWFRFCIITRLDSKVMVYFILRMNAAASAFKFGVLTKIVKHLRQKFQDGEDSPLTLEEVLDETNQLDVSGKTRHVIKRKMFLMTGVLGVVDKLIDNETNYALFCLNLVAVY